MDIVDEMERHEIIECWDEYGFTKGSEVHCLHQWRNLESNKRKSRREIEIDLVDRMRIRKLGKSTYDKTMSLLNKIQPKLMSRDMKSKLDYFVERLVG